MDVDERVQRALHLRLREVLGTEEADALMGQVFGEGADAVATRRDVESAEQRLGIRIDELDTRLGARIDGLEHRLGETEQRLVHRMDAGDAQTRAVLLETLNNQTRTMVFTVIGTNFTAVSLAFAAATFA